jgi:hypothetical protein
MRHADGYPRPGRAAMTWDGTFDPGAFGPPGGTLELRNLAGVVSGRLGAAPVAAETLRVEAGRVVSVGAAPAEADVVVDAAGAVAAPGLVDTHAMSCSATTPRASTPSGSWRATCTAASPR